MENYIWRKELIIAKRFSSTFLIDFYCVERINWRDRTAEEKIYRIIIFYLGC